MSGKNEASRIFFLVVMALVWSALPTWAGSAVIGSVAGSLNATIGGQALQPNTTLFSGDKLQVKDGAVVVAMGKGNRLVIGRETVASFVRESESVTVVLERGNISMYHPGDGAGVKVKAGEVVIEPAAGYKTLGDVAALNGGVVVTAKEGMLRVEESGRTVEVKQGQTITIASKAARAPQPQGGGAAAGAATSHISQGAIIGIIAVGAGGVAFITGVLAKNAANDAKDQAAKALAAARAACQAANAATSPAGTTPCP